MAICFQLSLNSAANSLDRSYSLISQEQSAVAWALETKGKVWLQASCGRKRLWVRDPRDPAALTLCPQNLARFMLFVLCFSFTSKKKKTHLTIVMKNTLLKETGRGDSEFEFQWKRKSCVPEIGRGRCEQGSTHKQTQMRKGSWQLFGGLPQAEFPWGVVLFQFFGKPVLFSQSSQCLLH